MDCIVVGRFLLCIFACVEKAAVLFPLSHHCYYQMILSISTVVNIWNLKYYWFPLVWLPHTFLCLFFVSLLHFLLSSTTHFHLCPVFHLLFLIIFAKDWQKPLFLENEWLLAWLRTAWLSFAWRWKTEERAHPVLSQMSCANNVFNLRYQFCPYNHFIYYIAVIQQKHDSLCSLACFFSSSKLLSNMLNTVLEVLFIWLFIFEGLGRRNRNAF